MIDQWNHGCKIIIGSMYSIHNKVKSVIAERFIRFLKKKNINTWLQYQKMCIWIN